MNTMTTTHHVDCGNQQTEYMNLECSLLCGFNDTPFYDYEHQAWVKNGTYQNCGHGLTTDCKCYGREHAGEAFREEV